MEVRFEYEAVNEYGKTVRFFGSWLYDRLPKYPLLNGYEVDLQACADYFKIHCTKSLLVFRDPNWYSDFTIGCARLVSKVEIAVIRNGDCFTVLVCPLLVTPKLL